MTWVKFSDRKPKLGEYLITRAPSKIRGASFIESWRMWDEQFINMQPHPLSHWWDGEPCFDAAVKDWNDNHEIRFNGELAWEIKPKTSEAS